MVTHPSTNPAVHGWELNLQSVGFKSDTLKNYTAKPHYNITVQ